MTNVKKLTLEVAGLSRTPASLAAKAQWSSQLQIEQKCAGLTSFKKSSLRRWRRKLSKFRRKKNKRRRSDKYFLVPFKKVLTKKSYCEKFYCHLILYNQKIIPSFYIGAIQSFMLCIRLTNHCRLLSWQQNNFRTFLLLLCHVPFFHQDFFHQDFFSRSIFFSTSIQVV